MHAVGTDWVDCELLQKRLR